MDLFRPDGTIDCLCFRLRKGARQATRLYERRLRPTGLQATQFTLLAMLDLMPDAGISDLAERTAIDRTGLTRNLDVLARRGLVAIAPGRDRRQRRVRILEAGRVLVAQARPLWEAAQREAADALGTERDTLVALLARLDRPAQGET